MEIELNGSLVMYKADIVAAVEKCRARYRILDRLVRRIYVTEMIPRFKYTFASIRTFYGQTIQFEIKLNIKAFGEEDIQTKLDSAAGTVYESIEDVMNHEMGHALSIFLIIDRLGLKLNSCGMNPLLKNPTTNRLLYNIIYRKYFKKFGKSMREIKELLGFYATHDIYELLPECFNYYYRLKRKRVLNETEKSQYAFVSSVIEDYENYIPRVKETNDLEIKGWR